MDNKDKQELIQGLQEAYRKERASARIYRDLAEHEANPEKKHVLIRLAETEEGHSQRWADWLNRLGGRVPPDVDTPRERIWRWTLVQTGTDNALKRIEDAEIDDTAMYASLAKLALSPEEKQEIQSVQHDEEFHSRLAHTVSVPQPPPLVNPQSRLDAILHRETWHKTGGGWLGQAIYGINDGLGSVFGIVTGVAGATAGGPAVLIAGLAAMLASAMSMGSGAYLATKTEREVQQAEVARERKELESHPEEEQEELALFYQLKGVPESEAQVLASRLVAQPDQALKTLASEELGLSEQTFPNPYTSALSATLSTAVGAFIPIIPFFFTKGYPAVIASFIISTLAHFVVGASKTIVTGLSPWRGGMEMTLIGFGEAAITYVLGLLFGPVVG